jgi:hypothetical protein
MEKNRDLAVPEAVSWRIEEGVALAFALVIRESGRISGTAVVSQKG